MERGDIYFVSLDPTAGHERQRQRPVVVLTTGAFNALTGVLGVLPITGGGGFARTRGFTVSLAGTRQGSFAAISRARSIFVPERRGTPASAFQASS